MLPAASSAALSPAARRRRSWTVAIGVLMLALAGALVGAALLASATPATRAAPGGTLRIFGAPPSSWDPARSSDVGSANTLAQVFEGLTTFDNDAEVRPALAQGWRVEDEGRRIVFRLRDGIRFSDGSPITADHVVSSWLRVLDPTRPSPLWSLLVDVTGAAEYRAGTGGRDAVGIEAVDGDVVVTFRRPAAYFPAAAGSATLAVLPEGLGDRIADETGVPQGIVASGGYVPSGASGEGFRLTANANYWAGPPAIETVELVGDAGERTLVEQYGDEEIDFTDVSVFDAAWLPYDEELGPDLRRFDEFSVTFYGFDTRSPPFDDARARRAFAMAVDWDRLLVLADPLAPPVTSLVPAGIPGRSDRDFTPAYDPDAARAELAGAGYPGGRGFPVVRMITGGTAFDEAIAADLERELAITVDVEAQVDDFFERLETDPPPFWSLVWIADYPDPHAFLGLLLESGSGSNYGRWSNEEYDAAIEAAASTADVAARQREFDRAQEIAAREVPVIPVSYGDAWALSRGDLLGASRNGLGLYRIAGMSWADE